MISIVIPALNEGKFIRDCLQSFRDQDYEGDYELIVVDNNSTDDTAAIARSFGVKLVPCSDKKGVFHARQVGADAAGGEIIVQADADTTYPADWLRKIADHFSSDPQAVAVNGRYTYKDAAPWWAGIEYFLRHHLNRLTRFLFGRPLIISGAVFAFRRSAFMAVNGYHGITYAPDQYGIAERLSKLGRVLYDGSAVALTSARTINKKPLLIIIRDVICHLGKWGIHFCEHCADIVQEFSRKTPRRRFAFKLLPVAIVFLTIIVYGYLIPTSPVFGKVYFEGSSKEKAIALTFDDGPNDPYTSEILDVLRKHNVKATFFVVGKNVELYPETARRIVAEGHVLGNHSHSHNANHALTDYGIKDLALAQQAIFLTAGVLPHLYRPPHGKKTPWELAAVKKQGLIEVTWNVSTSELGGKPATRIAQRIVQKTTHGDIILLHDGYGTSHNSAKSDKSATVQALPAIIEQLQARGYRFVTVPELLDVPAYGRQSNGPGSSPPASAELHGELQP